MWMPIPDIGKFGILTDPPSHLLPPGAWSTGKDVQFRDEHVTTFPDSAHIYGTPQIDPYWGINLTRGGNSYWLYASLTQFYSVLGNHHSNATRQSGSIDVNYSTSADSLWNGGNLSGRLVITNGVDVPQTWIPGARAFNLDNWPASNLICKLIRPFGYYLIAFNITDNSVRFPNRIRWSNAAAPGDLPSSWALNDPDVESGELDLPDAAAGEIIDAQPLRDWMYVYKNNSTSALRYVGGNAVFGTTPVFPDFGALSSDCVASFTHRGGAFHCVLTRDGVIIHDGRAVVKTLERRANRTLLRDLSPEYWQKSYVINHFGAKEVWICYAGGRQGSNFTDVPDKALIWNYSEDTLSFRDLPQGSTWITRGVIEGQEDTLAWNADSRPWDTDESEWNEESTQLHTILPVTFIPTGDNKGLVQLNVSNNNPVLPRRSGVVERRNLCYVPNRRTKEPMLDIESPKLLTGARFQIDGRARVSIGEVKNLDDSIGPQYGPSKEISTGETRLDYIASGIGFSVRIESVNNSDWQLHGYELDVEKTGTY